MERRTKHRFQVWFPVQVLTDEAGSIAMTHNVGAGGMLLASAASLEAGQRVKVTFVVPPSSGEYSLDGRVIRVEANPEDPEGTWPNRIALEFDQVTEELEPLLLAAQDRISEMP